MKTKVGTVNMRPSPGVLFAMALTQFERAAVRLVHVGRQVSSESAEYKEALARYDRKRQALLDYVQALESKEK